MMNEQTETAGTMPSTQQEKSLPAPKPQAGNPGIWIGLALCFLCILAFPRYMQMDDLGTGVFYGMDFLLLWIVIAGLSMTIVRRTNQHRATTTLKDRPKAKTPRWIHSLNGILFGVCILFLGLFLMTLPDSTNLGDLSLPGLLCLIIGIALIFLATLRLFYPPTPPVNEAAKPGSESKAQEQRSNTFTNAFYILAIGGIILVLPQITGLNIAFLRGFLDGMALFLLLIGCFTLGNAGFGRNTRVTSPGQ